MSLAHVDVDFSGTCDSTGAATIPLQALASQYGVLKVMGETQGSAQWTVLIKGRAVAPGRGPRVDLGPITVQPGEQITISILGAAAGAAVTGKLHGIGASSAQEALSNYVPSPNTIALDTFNQQTLLGSILTGGGGVPLAKTFTIPPGTQGVGYLIDQNAGHSPPTTASGITMVGSASAYPYITFSTNAGGLLAAAFTEQAGSTEFFASIDPKVICTVKDPNVGTPSLVYFYAYAYNPKVRSDISPQGSPVPVNNVSPTLWQAPTLFLPFQATINAGATLTLLAGVVGQAIYLHGFTIGFTLIATNLVLEDSTGVNIFQMADAASGVPQYYTHDFKGVPLVAGRGVQIGNTGGNAVTVWGGLDVAQG